MMDHQGSLVEPSQNTRASVLAPTLWQRVRPWVLPVLTLVLLVWAAIAPDLVFAATTTPTPPPIPPVSYGTTTTGGTTFDTTIQSGLQNAALIIRDVLGATALLVILVAAVMNHFVHDPRAKERAKELIGAAVVGLLLAAFAPAIVNFIISL